MNDDPSEAFADAMDRHYQRVWADWKRLGRCKAPKLNVATYSELRKAFLPGRSMETVSKAGNKVAGIARNLFANTHLWDNGIPPSCKAVGLEDDKGWDDSCYFEEEGPSLICDCQKGYAIYSPDDYAEEHAVKCVPGKGPIIARSDYPRGLGEGLAQYTTSKEAEDVSGMVLGLDTMINAIHGSGAMADWLVEGGQRTLDKLRNR